ncbi:P-loop containing nucleoside triphosphate hydrolase protein [Suillus bovinus]|uniref:P-loop containing nucleoside triphosphate hydrolase protein n=1 Tax=Suillus bovinus TaxID=48563 RepID=UPI001B8852C7|nr:P-loop containing nucleoside triphosphate hydrolase protein [Suillus bovinus]KAG2131410.1 P-loop containing nucleoside triphosphate hydrolase protein [Suillus bovinus]
MLSIGGEQCAVTVSNESGAINLTRNYLHIPNQTEASHHTKETCNVVIFGETGAGKSSLINLVAKKHTAQTSRDATGCTIKPIGYDVSMQNNHLKVKLFDTPGLDEGSEGAVPHKEAQQVLKKLIESLRDDVQLLIYCVRGVRASKALCRNYNFIRSEVKERVPIVLVATCLEYQEPEMEDWWKNNERLISGFGMTFAGHACVTTVTINEDEGTRLKQRHDQSYHALCQLIEQCRTKGSQCHGSLLDVGDRHHNTIRQVPPEMVTGDSVFSCSSYRILPTLINRNSIVLTGDSVASSGSPASVREIAATYPDQQRRAPQRQDTVANSEVFNTTHKRKTIVVFGETGAGKSSLVNLMAGKEVARTSPDTQRCTMRWTEYPIDFHGSSYMVFDTIGLEEPQLGIKEYIESVENAYKLVRELDEKGGIDLLIFCIRASRVTATHQSNYRLFHEFLCEKKVPMVLAITNLEREQRMEDWWDRNKETFNKYKIKVAGHVCITTASRLDGRHKDLYEQSRITIRKLVEEFTADGQKQAWMGGDNLFVLLMRRLKGLLAIGSHVKRKDIVPRLTKRCGISPDVAKQLADAIKLV